MKKIFIHRFHCLNNYGSGMMGLVTLDQLDRKLNGQAEFYIQAENDAVLDEIRSELDRPISIKLHPKKEIDWSKWKWIRSLQKRQYLIDASEILPYDAVFILGGDDLSEYYTDKIYRDLLQYWRWSLSRPVILWQQSMGPFRRPKNRLVMKYFYRKIPIYVRDAWSKQYLAREFGLTKNVYQGADLAFYDLPLQKDKSIEKDILQRYGLQPDNYITLVISGLQGKYYTSDKQAYFTAYRQLLERLRQHPFTASLPVVLLAHTFPPHGNEAKQIREFLQFLPDDMKENLIPVTEKILPTRARFILGNGRLTITGRMHAAISTFQPGKPAISLSYSAKYEGVIGRNLNRSDLIIDADKPALWNSGEIVDLIMEKVDYTAENYDRLLREIRHKTHEQKQILKHNFDSLHF